jgi:hypothetical protein
MKNGKALAATFFALSSFSLLLFAQQTTPTDPKQDGVQPSPAQPSATASAPQVEYSTVKGELVEKLNSKTAKTGDSVVIKTKSNVKTQDGTEIPKGSKLVGHVTAVKPSGNGNENSQVAIQFDRAELKGGQSMAILSEIQSLSPAGAEVAASPAEAMPSAPSSAPSSGAASQGGGMSGSGTPAAPAAPAQQMPSSQRSQPSQSQPSGPAVGTVVARTGNIAIRTTAIPGVLLASNEPGQPDPRMAQSSGILLGARKDIQLDEGTEVVIGVASSQPDGTSK